jgi:hypothetical protein
MKYVKKNYIEPAGTFLSFGVVLQVQALFDGGGSMQ